MEEIKKIIEIPFIHFIREKIYKPTLSKVEENNRGRSTPSQHSKIISRSSSGSKKEQMIPFTPFGVKKQKSREFNHPFRKVVESNENKVKEIENLSEQSYEFFCTNGTNNLKSILVPNSSGDLRSPTELSLRNVGGVNAPRPEYISNNNLLVEESEMNDLRTISFDEEQDLTERIIPEYYINETGIKVGALNFDFYNSILDSIRNMRVLSKYQIKYIDKWCTQEEYHEIMIEYNKVIKMLNESNIL